MKKRNWLMTIAFAVLSLTIVSTMVIGSTYAKFVSQVTGNAQVQAAGFLVAGTVADAQVSGLMGPEKSVTQPISIKYFSQVDTDISEASATANSGLAGTGIFASTTTNNETTYTYWDALVDYYNLHWQEIAVALGYGHMTTSEASSYVSYGLTGLTGGAVTDTAENPLAPTDLIAMTVNGTAADSLVDAFISAILTDTNIGTHFTAGEQSATAYREAAVTAHRIPAMNANAASALTVNFNVSIAWTTLKCVETGHTNEDNNLFDTFIGNCIEALATGEGLSYTYRVDGANADTTINVFGTDTTGSGAIDYAVDYAAGAVGISKLGVSVGLRAEQYIAPANNG